MYCTVVLGRTVRFWMTNLTNQTEDTSVPKREPKLFTFKIFLGKLLYRKSAKKLCSQKAKDNNNNNFSRKAKDNMEIDYMPLMPLRLKLTKWR